jgi:hypothetical protein
MAPEMPNSAYLIIDQDEAKYVQEQAQCSTNPVEKHRVITTVWRGYATNTQASETTIPHTNVMSSLSPKGTL